MSRSSLVDPSFELSDPCPDIHALFIQFDARFFGGSLACCEVKWSPRMYACAGICSYEIRGGRGGLCSIRLSKPLLTLRPRSDLVETLLHEMIHAYLFVKERNRDRDGHGPQFQAHMHRINQAGGTNITIYHSFHDEVRLYKQHWWRCSGPCRDRRPFFGYVKRSCNRAPGPNDRWWSQHQQSCGGNFLKVKEPEGYGQGKGSKRTNDKNKSGGPALKKTITPPRVTLDDFFKKDGKNSSDNSTSKSPTKPSTSLFTGSGQKLGGSSSTSSLLNSYPKATQNSGGNRLGGTSGGVSRLLPPVNFTSPSSAPVAEQVIDLGDSDDDDFQDMDDDALEISFVASDNSVICPSCNTEVMENLIHGHLDYCLG
ncbi:DNA-dependent metalloprotease dvc-1 [Caenorhabditis elegans]|uniref:DNA-dependent metalloprotease dvc-1 n=1 Tax=Caenorhabditis elegans TaxID=6239 RepID=SPRTN_CAEEL|nr:DNA-dependent metalloprotease dvc-1 [Caenorhabditis elegans]Q22557.1 RecName: Full=DNA-dependent metalloprotease dvc-1; AltName: Full=DNA damage protein targeting VCP; Short=DVC1; AltName: Full=Protein with SprT-like domain at the N terminus; Short=Spartan [Caenorhabditis elegans]CAA98538.1 DNA-dependent metalloprotease dvc-1 [Caenorhabditis elegans]|eukprot:NP_505853.1 SprT-like domain-containing protein Spartan [Caenorhabditis elegans]